MQEDLLKAKEIIQKQKEEQSAKLKKMKKNKTLRYFSTDLIYF